MNHPRWMNQPPYAPYKKTPSQKNRKFKTQKKEEKTQLRIQETQPQYHHKASHTAVRIPASPPPLAAASWTRRGTRNTPASRYSPLSPVVLSLGKDVPTAHDRLHSAHNLLSRKLVAANEKHLSVYLTLSSRQTGPPCRVKQQDFRASRKFLRPRMRKIVHRYCPRTSSLQTLCHLLGFARSVLTKNKREARMVVVNSHQTPKQVWQPLRALDEWG